MRLNSDMDDTTCLDRSMPRKRRSSALSTVGSKGGRVKSGGDKNTGPAY